MPLIAAVADRIELLAWDLACLLHLMLQALKFFGGVTILILPLAVLGQQGHAELIRENAADIRALRDSMYWSTTDLALLLTAFSIVAGLIVLVTQSVVFGRVNASVVRLINGLRVELKDDMQKMISAIRREN